MKITVKDLTAFQDLELGNNGLAFDVYDNKGNRLGDLRLGRATIEWCKGKEHTGVKKNWKDLIAFFEN